MDVLFPVAADASDQRQSDAKGSERSRNDHRIDESNDEDVEDDETERYRVAKKTFETLLPSLYRSGQPSWNPTVNKMTALGLKRFMVMTAVPSFLVEPVRGLLCSLTTAGNQ